MTRLGWLGVVACAGLAAGCFRAVNGSAAGPSIHEQRVFDKYDVTVEVGDGNMSSSSGTTNDGAGHVDEHFEFKTGGHTLAIHNDELSLDGRPRGRLKPGDKVRLTVDGTLRVNGREAVTGTAAAVRRGGMTAAEEAAVREMLDLNRQAGPEHEPEFLALEAADLRDHTGKPVRVLRVSFRTGANPQPYDRLYRCEGRDIGRGVMNRFGDDWRTKADGMDWGKPGA